MSSLKVLMVIKLLVLFAISINAFAQNTESIALLENRCERGDFMTCNNLGVRYIEGNGVVRNYRKAIEKFNMACEGGESSGCFNIGQRYQEGEGFAKDYRKALEYYEKSCKLGSIDGCLNVGIYYYNGMSVMVDKDRAIKIFQNVCGRGLKEGCDAYDTAITNSGGRQREQCWSLIGRERLIDRMLARAGRPAEFTRCFYRHPHRSFENKNQIDIFNGEACPKYPADCR